MVKRIMRDGPTGIGRPSIYHAVVVIFLEFFAWGLLTTPMLRVLHETFPSAHVPDERSDPGREGLAFVHVGSSDWSDLSDVWGRRSCPSDHRYRHRREITLIEAKNHGTEEQGRKKKGEKKKRQEESKEEKEGKREKNRRE
ncbi:unnamed protein product [Arctogadus glacialis]